MRPGFRLSFLTSLLAVSLWPTAPASSQNVLPPLAPLSQPGKLTPSATDHFRFVVAGDNRPAKETDPLPPSVAYIFSQIKKEAKGNSGVAFALWAGDTIYGKDNGNEQKIRKQYAAFQALAATGGVPVFNAPGNHEMCIKGAVNAKGKKIDAYDPTGHLAAWYTQAMSALYGTFTYGNCAFIALNTDDRLDRGVSISPPDYNGYVGKAQRRALKATLAAYARDRRIRHVFVFMHRPIHAWPTDAKNALGAPSHDPLQAILDDCKRYPNLSFVFAAHQHLFYRYRPKKPDHAKAHTKPVVRDDPASVPPVYVVSGGAGAPLTGKATPKTGGFHHYLLVEVKGDRVTFKVVPLPKSAPGAHK